MSFGLPGEFPGLEPKSNERTFPGTRAVARVDREKLAERSVNIEKSAPFRRKVEQRDAFYVSNVDMLAQRSIIVAQLAILLAKDETQTPYLADRPITEGNTAMDTLTPKELGSVNEAMRILGQALGYPMQGEQQ